MAGQVKQIGQNTAEEFFETILYMTAYDVTKSVMAEYTKDIDSPILKEAVESAMSVAVFGAVFLAVQKQEELIAKIFNLAEGLIIALALKAKNIFSKIKGLKGTKLFRKLSFLQGRNQDDLAIAQIVATHQGFKANVKSSEIVGQNTSTQRTVGSSYQMYNDTKQTLYQRENLHFQFGNAMASRYNETLLFKLFTKSFTSQDEMLIKKMLGRETGAAISIADLNQVADFMFVKDTNGKLTGFTEAFFQFVNTMGYVNK